MIIKEPDPKTKKVEDFDFTFSNGLMLQVTIDKEAGDTMEYPTPDTIVIHLVSRTGIDDETEIPGKDLTIYVKNVLTIQHISREIIELTHAQREDWKKALFNTPKLVQ